jgi:hypothetical protein
MPIRKLYSQRNAPGITGTPVFNAISYKLKQQVFHLWDDFLAQKRIDNDVKKTAWQGIFKTVCREHGHGKTIYQGKKSPREQVEEYYNSFSLGDVGNHLDIVEIIFYEMKRIQSYYRQGWHQPLKLSYELSVKHLNERFIENNFGYRFEQHQVFRIENEYYHKEVVKPSLELLKDEIFKNVNQEFLLAHEYFRKNLFEPCIVECVKAFESTMKVICHGMNWPYDQKDTASPLIRKIIESELIPKYFETSLISIATIRNKTSAHGKGVSNVELNDRLALYVLNQTAAIIMYLVESFKSSASKSDKNTSQ